MAWLLVLKKDVPGASKGTIVGTRASGSGLTPKEAQSFVGIEVVGAPMTNYMVYGLKWRLDIAFEVVGRDVAQDGYRLRLYSQNAGSVGGVTRDDVEGWVEKWGGSVFSVGPNEVVFDIRIYDALISEAFWEFDLSNVVFSEISYDTETGIHRIEADYSTIQKNPSYVERYVHSAGLDIVSHADKVLTYDADRTVVREAFQENIKKFSKRKIADSRFYLPDGVVDYIEGQGGFVTTDAQTLLGYIRDKASE